MMPGLTTIEIKGIHGQSNNQLTTIVVLSLPTPFLKEVVSSTLISGLQQKLVFAP